MLKAKKIISLCLIMFLIVATLPAKVRADDSSNNQKNSIKTQQKHKDKKKKVGKITKEITEQRTKNSKKFQKDDGSFEVAEYPEQIHYLENCKWEDIDNSLADTKDQDGNDCLQNKKNDFKVKISKDVASQKLVDLQKDKYDVSWNLQKTNKSEAVTANLDETKLDDEIKKTVDAEVTKDKELSAESNTDKEEAKSILTENEKIKTLKKVTSNVNFANAFENTDLQYILKGSEVKENLVLNKKTDNVAYSFNINVKHLKAVLQKDKSIIFYDSVDGNKAVFKIDEPIMYDNAGNASSNINITLNNAADGYQMTLTPDKEWLNSSDRAYPVTIDPSMNTSLDVSAIHDTFVCSNDTENKLNNQYVRVGQTPVVGLTRSYIKFDLPQLTTGDMIVGAQLALVYASGVSGSGAKQVNVHKVNQDFNPDTLTWGTQPGYDSNIEALSIVNSATDAWATWDITSIAKQWFTQGSNYGLMLEEDNGGNYSSFWSSNIYHTYAADRPQVSFEYVNNSGLESYWTYHSQSVGRAGTSYVNDYNGNLIFTHNDISMSGSRMPVSINHVFNSNDRTLNIGTGNGWRLNVNQRLETQNISGTNYYKYTDEDGTRHYFKDTGASSLSDELNLGLTLNKESDGTISISDKKNNKIDFNAAINDLNYIADANGNKMTFTYSGGSCNGVRNITKVTDGAGRTTTLNYSNNLLTAIVDTANRTTSYGYDGNGNLHTITYPDGKISTYNYDGNHNLTSAVNYDGYEMSYQYYGVSPYRVSHILESNTDGTLGDELSVSYGNNSTSFTDVKGRKNIYQFDEKGKTICIKDADGSAQYYQYGDTSNSTKLTSASKLQKTVINLLSNPDVESSDSWSGSADGGTGTGSITSEASYLGNKSIKITKSDNVSRQYMNEWLNLQKGKTYTFSAYVKTVNVSNTAGGGATVSAYCMDSSGGYHITESKTLNGTKDWQRISVTFTVPGNAMNGSVCIRVDLLNETGTAYFDSMQVEEGNIANRYNLVDNGDLSSSNRWTGVNTSGSDGIVTVSDSDHPSNLDNNVYQVTGAYGVNKSIAESVNVHGKAGDIYTLGGWAKGYSVPSGAFQIQAAFLGANGAQWVSFDFNKDSNDWQYVSGQCIANQDYSRIDIYCFYASNANKAYFDGVQLYKEQFGQSYQYDSKGNTVSTASLAKQNSNFQYNGNNDLIQSVDAKGGAFNYTYDSKHNITGANTAAGVNYGFGYDSYGNPTSAKIGDSTGSINSSATYYPSGNYIKSLTDSLGNTVNYSYDETKGLLTSLSDAKGSTTSNSYDPNTDALTSTSKTVNGQTVTNNYAYKNDKISQIIHNGFSYNFGYDSLGNNTTVAVGNQNLITNNYESRSGLLLSSTYGNGQVMGNSYDSYDRLTGKSYNGTNRYNYQYDSSDNVGFKQDLVNGVNYNYVYDTSDRLVSTKDSNNNFTNYQYDLNNNISSVLDNINNKGYVTSYSYDKDNKQKEVNYTRNSNSGELFSLNGTDYGTNGTKPMTSNINAGTSGTTSISNVTSEGYDISVTVTSAAGGVNHVIFPTWTLNNGQDDLVWGKPTSVNGDTYTYHVNRSDHKNEYGTYATDVYIYDNAGNSKAIGNRVSLVSTPTAVTAVIKNADCNGYDVAATVKSAQGGVNHILLATWTSNNGQDDLTWISPASVSGNTYTFHVNRSDHKSEYGFYESDVWLYDNNGGAVGYGTHTTLNSTSLSVTAAIKNVTSNGYDVVANVTPGSSAIKSISFPTWTNYNGQDDIVWGAPTSVNGDTYTYHVNKSDHKSEYGFYNTHVYVYDQAGGSAFYPTSGVTLYAPVNGIDMTVDNGKTEMLADGGTTQAVYSLGVNKNAGTVSAKFKTYTAGELRYILSAQGANDEGFNVYLGTDDKLKAAVRNSAGDMVDLASSSTAVSANQWNFVALNWQVANGTLSVTLYLNNTAYTGRTTDFKDFTGANIAVGSSLTKNVPLKGEMEQFTYSPAAMSSTDIQNISTGASNNVVDYSYDNLGRLTTQTANTGTATNAVSYTYKAGAAITGVNGATSTRVDTMNNNGNKIAYTYDANGNIKTITQNGQTITYTYNELNEVTREDNQVLNKSVVYSYDAGGNITSKIEYAYTTGALGTATSTINYGYGDSNWKDKLTSYNGKTITYDQIGNPLNDGTYNYTWEEGRQLSGITGNGKTITYKYNDSGIRTQKTVNGVTTNYHLEGSNVTFESDGTNNIYYTYDSAGKLLSMNLNGTEYYYIYNAQGDIIGLFDKTGTQVVSYTYDTWGKLVAIGGSLKNTVGTVNPYRYRGYRYDTETGLYYLQSRYYNPEWGRFINADATGGSVGELLSHNVFAYCKNNPVNMSDADGYRPEFSGTGHDSEEEIADSLASMRAAEQITYAHMNELGKGWSYRREKSKDKSTGERDHIQVRSPKGKVVGQNDNGKPHPTVVPSPPGWVKDELKDREEWDWDANNEKWQRNQNSIIGLSGKALIIYLIISEGSRIFPLRDLIPVP